MRTSGIAFFFLFAVLSGLTVRGQNIKFTEYDLDNGLHVILHQDTTNPVVAVSVLYHVGSKDEAVGRTGFAHFFEHLLFEGTENIGRGEFMKFVSSRGGRLDAFTTFDQTYYFEMLTSNELELGLWLESERMMHPVINDVGVKTQKEVVKEEKRMRFDNQPYGMLLFSTLERLFKKHPYSRSLIGSMEDLDSAGVSDFTAFFKKYYGPNNAVLAIAGDIDIAKTKKLVEAYFGPIPRGPEVVRPQITEEPITEQIVDTVYDNNIQIPGIITAYRVPGLKSQDSKVIELIGNYLSNGASSKLYKKLVDDKKEALAVQAFNLGLEDYGAYLTFALPNGPVPLDTLLHEIDKEIGKVRTSLISEEDMQKLKNEVETRIVSQNQRMFGIAQNLAEAYTMRKNTGYVNEELDDYRKITREQIREVANKYLKPDQRVVIYYLPKKAGAGE